MIYIHSSTHVKIWDQISDALVKVSGSNEKQGIIFSELLFNVLFAFKTQIILISWIKYLIR